jgi:hypothetical protein
LILIDSPLSLLPSPFSGALLLAFGWVPSDNIWIKTHSHFSWIPYGIATFLYAAMNDMARIAMNATLQANIPPAAGSGSNIIGICASLLFNSLPSSSSFEVN